MASLPVPAERRRRSPSYSVGQMRSDEPAPAHPFLDLEKSEPQAGDQSRSLLGEWVPGTRSHGVSIEFCTLPSLTMYRSAFSGHNVSLLSTSQYWPCRRIGAVRQLVRSDGAQCPGKATVTRFGPQWQQPTGAPQVRMASGPGLPRRHLGPRMAGLQLGRWRRLEIDLGSHRRGRKPRRLCPRRRHTGLLSPSPFDRSDSSSPHVDRVTSELNMSKYNTVHAGLPAVLHRRLQRA